MKSVKRGEIYMSTLPEGTGSEQKGTRPVLVIQNDIGNKYSPTVIVLVITSKVGIKAKLPTHVFLSAEECGLDLDSLVLAEQVKTIDKSRLIERKTTLNEKDMDRVNAALQVSVGLYSSAYAYAG